MQFEYDPHKSRSNQDKHGIDFDAAQQLWEDANAVEFKVAYEDEPRYAVIGKIREKHWTAIITYRNKKVRIISVRRAREKEVAAYE
ncbi:MAG: BrnT family toxin, partial [Raoultibacter sp.]